MIFAVTEIAVTTGAVAEFQRGMRYIGPAADTAPVGVTGRGGCCLADNRDRLRDVFALALDEGEEIQNILACEQQIVQKTDQREQVVGEKENGRGEIDDLDANQYQIYKT